MGDKLRAFVVEDSPVILENLQGLLEELGSVRVVASAAAESEACAWMDGRSNGCDVAIIDMLLASGSGLGILQHMKAYQAPPVRVVLTNYATPGMRSRCRALGAEAVLDKSTEIQDLIDWLTTQVRH